MMKNIFNPEWVLVCLLVHGYVAIGLVCDFIIARVLSATM